MLKYIKLDLIIVVVPDMLGVGCVSEEHGGGGSLIFGGWSKTLIYEDGVCQPPKIHEP